MKGVQIQILPPSVAERIAAGEVIERPSSVVKELVENSIDAGATEIAVVLTDGGKELIEVIDNGRGMCPEDLKLSVLRHATSKLSSLEDLEKIRTLGFRGEALPSIAAVSELNILSRARDSDTAYLLHASGERPGKCKAELEKITFGHFLHSPHGTRIQARGLFSQVPARLKFLKSPAAEVSQTREWIERVALAHPNVGFKLVSGLPNGDGRTLLNLRPSDPASRAKAILSEEEDYPLVEAETLFAGGQNAKARIFWFQGLSLPSSRKLLQVVNGRSVRDRLLQQAVMAAFRQALLPGQFPALALFIEIDPSQIDVNVHPTKTELRFLDSRSVFRAVSSLIEASLVKHGAPAFAAGFSSGSHSELPHRFSSADADFASKTTFDRSSQAPTLWSLAEVSETLHPLSHAAFLGTLFGTYFVFDDRASDDRFEMVLVDQHAAHERIRYEKLQRRATTTASPCDLPPSQALLMPETVKFPVEQRLSLEHGLPLLTRLGFEAELFSEDTLLIRAIPPEWGTRELGPRLQSLIERLVAASESGREPVLPKHALVWDEALFEKIASEACHSAIRAGDRVDGSQALDIVRQLFACEHPWNCPHGRPTVVRIPRGKLEEWFQRRV